MVAHGGDSQPDTCTTGWGADQSFELKKAASPVKAYLDVDEIIRIASENGVDAIHPGYGFLSESPEFASACAPCGEMWVWSPCVAMWPRDDIGTDIVHMAALSIAPGPELVSRHQRECFGRLR